MVYLILLAVVLSAIIGICLAYVSYFTAYKIEKKKELYKKLEKFEEDNNKIVKLIYDNAVKLIIEKHNYKLEECNIKYEILDSNRVSVKIRPIKEVAEYELDIIIE